MAGKKTGKRLLTWVLVLVMALSLLPLNVLAASPAVMRIVRPDTDKYITYEFYNGEAKVDEQIIKTGDTLLEPEIETQKGKRLKGWYTAQENGDLFTNFGNYTSEITENTTIALYAKFEDVYYVYFKDTTGRIVATKEGVTGAKIKFDDVSFPVESDESITGWYLEGDQGKTAVTSVTLESTNVTLCAIVEKGHWITFDSKGGSYVEPQFVTGPTKAPTPPTKLGYTFAGWKNGDTAFTFGSALDADITLTAKWTAKDEVNYTVIHWLENADDDDYSYKESETLTGTAGELTEDAVDKSYEGFTLDKVEQKEIAGDGSTIVNVYYKRNVYNVTFASDTESGEDLICGKEAHKHTYAERTWFFGYKCKGGCYPSERYSRTPICGKEEHTHKNSCYGKLLKDLTITAKYGANISNRWPTYNGSSTWKTSKNGNTYQVNIDTMPLGGANFYGPKTGSGSQTAHYYVEVLPGESGTVENGVTYKLYRSDTSPGTGYDVTEEDKYPITGFTYKEGTPNGYAYDNAKFYYTRNSYNIIFINGGETEKTENKKYQQDISTVSYTPTAPAGKEGYKFAGWFDNELCEGTAYKFNGKTMPANNITLYAKWVEPVHKVEFLVDNKVVTDWTKPDVAHNSTISDLPTPTSSTGDTFLGWVHANGKPFHPSTKITDDLTLYAKFGNKTGYSVTYNYKNGSSLVIDPSKYAKGAFATVFDGPAAAPANKVFLGWTTDEDDTEVEYYPNSSIEITGDVTLYAVYGDKAETVTVTYHSNFGTDSPYTTDAMPNNGKFTVADYKALGLPENNGYEFIGWSTNPGEQKVEFKKDESARADTNGSNDLYAQWKLKTIETEVVVKITGKTSTKTYNGSEQSITGYTVESISDSRYTANDFTFSGTALAKGTDAKTYQMGLKVEQFENKNSQFTNVKFEVTDGWLKIEPRNVTLTSASASKVYDGTPLTKPTVTVDGDGFVEGEVADIRAIGSVTNVSDGEVTNTIEYTTTDNFKTDNYTITKTEGKLNITPVTDEVTVTITGNTKTVRYNGKEQTVEGYKVSIDNELYKESDFKFNGNAEAKGTNAGTYPMGLTKESFENTNKNFTNVVFVVEDGYLKIKRHSVATPSKPTLNTGDHYAYVMGYPDGTVRPNGSITRAEVSTILFRLLSDKTRDEYFTTESSFTDVKAGAWYNNSIATLEKAGVIVDTAKGGAFRPNEAITRAELAAMLAQFSDAKPVKGVKFSDVSAEHWAYEAIAIAAKMGWIEGYPDGTFRPDATITRAEMMTLVNRALERVPSDEDHLLSKRVMLTFPDCKSGDWFYIAVQEATNSHTYERAATEKNGDEQWTALRANRDWTQLEK